MNDFSDDKFKGHREIRRSFINLEDDNEEDENQGMAIYYGTYGFNLMQNFFKFNLRILEIEIYKHTPDKQSTTKKSIRHTSNSKKSEKLRDSNEEVIVSITKTDRVHRGNWDNDYMDSLNHNSALIQALSNQIDICDDTIGQVNDHIYQNHNFRSKLKS